jgi:Flp pilus assembly protein TadD
VASLRRAAREAPNDFRVWGNLGDALRGAGDRGESNAAYAKSISLAREQLRLNPADSEAYSYIATSLAKTGSPGEAAEQIKAAIALGDRDANLLVDAAVVAVLGGREREALDWLRKAVDAGYCRELLAKQSEFAPLRGDSEFRSIIAAPRSAAGS